MDEPHDVFISHASEDKVAFVRPLADSLIRLGVRVWLDQFTLTLGDSLSRSVDKGLASSNYGLVVLSPAFLEKNWPEYELRGLISREMTGRKVILPIWHNVGHSDLLRYSPSLADKYALDTSKLSFSEIVLQILKVVRPDIFDNLLRRQEWRRIIAQGETKIVSREEINFVLGPIRHQSLPRSMLLRMRLVHLILYEVRKLTIEELIDDFRRDLHPENELPIWENIAAAYLEATSKNNLTLKEKKEVFGGLLQISFMPPGESLSQRDEDFRQLAEIYHSIIPIIPTDNGSKT